MKNIIISASIIVLSLTFAPQSNASSIAQSLCEFVNVDNKVRLRSFLKANKLKVRNVFNSTSCNGQNLLEFAAQRNATETGTMIIRKLSKTIVKNNLAVLSSTSLSSVAEQRVNG
ncbi:DUF3718 domain-containing protein [Thalassotalea sp. G2M2-11]|uniref:DUF3718 domain-containing protein n=1 Tax=Thalassotalea sp. G2M2-11 TaxID=2787627 RepID=UPI0019CFC0B6|nr:DUF3718 domain-containing protein [Thalassotalea sp. G2M2-11]